MKWLVRIVLVLLTLVVLAVGVVYAWSSMILSNRYEAKARTVQLFSRPEILARGERLSKVYGCYRGCHGDDMEGQVFIDRWYVARVITPSLTRAVRERSISELEAAIRQGVRPDGRSVVIMPPASYASMSDRDLGAILSFVRSYPHESEEPGETSFGPLARVLFVMGRFLPAAQQVMQVPLANGIGTDPARLGEYLAVTACSECHGLSLDGADAFAPSLAVVKAYSLEDFRRLMADGTGLGGRDLGPMTEIAKVRFSRLTGAEVATLHDFLTSR